MTVASDHAAKSGSGWKMRLEDPFSRYYRYPVARLIVRLLVHTPVTPNQVTMVQPVLAGVAGWMITFADARHLLFAALLFELRALLDCVDGTLARAKNMTSAGGHAIDGLADWVATGLLYVGIFWHFRLHPPPVGPWTRYVSTNGILMLALFQGAMRSFAADYYKTKYTSIFESGRDETVHALLQKTTAIRADSPIFAHIDLFVARLGHLFFAHEWFDHASSAGDRVKQLLREEGSPRSRLIGFLWAISNGDFFLSMLCLSMVTGTLWLAQVFFATVGMVWIAAVVLLNGWFVRRAGRRAMTAVA